MKYVRCISINEGKKKSLISIHNIHNLKYLKDYELHDLIMNIEHKQPTQNTKRKNNFYLHKNIPNSLSVFKTVVSINFCF